MNLSAASCNRLGLLLLVWPVYVTIVGALRTFLFNIELPLPYPEFFGSNTTIITHIVGIPLSLIAAWICFRASRISLTTTSPNSQIGSQKKSPGEKLLYIVVGVLALIVLFIYFVFNALSNFGF